MLEETSYKPYYCALDRKYNNAFQNTEMKKNEHEAYWEFNIVFMYSAHNNAHLIFCLWNFYNKCYFMYSKLAFK